MDAVQGLSIALDGSDSTLDSTGGEVRGGGEEGVAEQRLPD